MNSYEARAVLIAGLSGPLGPALARELARDGACPCFLGQESPPDAAPELVYFCPADGDAPITPSLEAVAGLSRGLVHVCVVAPSPASAPALAAEDALRYLADRTGAAFAVIRVPRRRLSRRASAASLSALAADIARWRVGGTPFSAPSPADRAPRGPRRSPSGPPVFLITGAAGLVGRALTRLLDQRGLMHLDVDLFPTPAGATAAPFLQCNLAEPDLKRLSDFCRPATHAVHLAAAISNEKELAGHYGILHRVNVGGTLNLLKALPPTLRHFSFASSMTVYGSPRVLPVDETAPLEPNCVYALTKRACEHALSDYSARAGVPVAFLRFSSVYGPGPANGRAIPRMITRLLEGKPPQIYGDGSVTRDYIHADDLSRAVVEASAREVEGAFNVGSGRGTSILELSEALIRLTGSRLAPVHLPAPEDAQASSSVVYDIGKMRRELGVGPRVSLETGLRGLVAYHQDAFCGGLHEP